GEIWRTWTCASLPEPRVFHRIGDHPVPRHAASEQLDRARSDAPQPSQLKLEEQGVGDIVLFTRETAGRHTESPASTTAHVFETGKRFGDTAFVNRARDAAHTIQTLRDRPLSRNIEVAQHVAGIAVAEVENLVILGMVAHTHVVALGIVVLRVVLPF